MIAFETQSNGSKEAPHIVVFSSFNIDMNCKHYIVGASSKDITVALEEAINIHNVQKNGYAASAYRSVATNIHCWMLPKELAAFKSWLSPLPHA